MNFNLIDDPWIPVLRQDGTYERVGALRALAEARAFRQLAAPNPMDRFAIFRFLLALLYWCRGNPEESPEFTFSEDGFRKLAENKDSFELFGDGPRFFQFGTASMEKMAANYLVHEVPTRTNFWHFRHATDVVDGLCPACCASGLVRLPLFSTSGGRGKPPGINFKPPLYVVPIGNSLESTLRLSWHHQVRIGSPCWAGGEPPSRLSPPIALLEGFTWLPRRVWLDDTEASDGACVACGQIAPLVRECVFTGIGSTKSGDDEESHIWQDPHVLYQIDHKSQRTSLHASDALGQSDAACGHWSRIVSALIDNRPANGGGAAPSDQGGLNAHAEFWVIGFATVQNDKYLEATDRTFRVRVAPLRDSVAREMLDRWRAESTRLEKQIDRSESRGRSAATSVRPHIEQSVRSRAAELLAEDESAWAETANEFAPFMDSLARSLSPGFTIAATDRRAKIAAVRPDVNPAPKSAKDKSKKKGGTK